MQSRVKLQPKTDPFAIPAHRVRHEHKRAHRAKIRQFINPGNVGFLLEHIPGEGESVRALVRGDFVLGDIVPAYLEKLGTSCPHLRVCSLGISKANVKTFESLLKSGKVEQLSILTSLYFSATDRVEAFGHMCAALRPLGAKIGVARVHAKLIMLPTANGDWFSMEGSGNCRYSGNVEQLLIENDPETFNFYADFIDEMIRENPVNQ